MSFQRTLVRGFLVTFGVFLLFIVGTVFIFVARAYTVYANVSVRYRIDVAIEIEGQKYLGSDVFEIDYVPQDPLLNIFNMDYHVAVYLRGEALMLDMDNRGKLLVPLKYDLIRNVSNPPQGRMSRPLRLDDFVFANVLGHYGRGIGSAVDYNEIKTLTNFKPIVAQPQYYLPFLYIPKGVGLDGIRLLIADTTSQNSLTPPVGMPVRVLEENISVTDAQLTEGQLNDLHPKIMLTNNGEYFSATVFDPTGKQTLELAVTSLFGDAK